MALPIHRTGNRPLIVGEEPLRSLHTFLQEHYPNLTLTITCRDGVGWQDIPFAQVLAFENEFSRRITSIRFRGDHPDGQGCFVEIGSGPYSTYALSVVSDTGATARAMADGVEARVRAMKSPYRWLFVPLGPAFAPPVVFNCVFVMSSVYLGPGYVQWWLDHQLLSLPAFAAISLAVLLGLNRLGSWAFPYVAFAIGRQKSESKTRLGWGSVILVALAFGLVWFVTSAHTLFEPVKQ